MDPSREPPSVLILLDRSGSMYTATTDRWTPAVSAINSVVAGHPGELAFGVGLFGAGVGCTGGSVSVAPAVNTADAIAATLAGDPAMRTGGGTPTSDMLARARSFYASRGGERYVVLVTDGAPNCNALQAGRTQCLCTFDDCVNTPTPWLGCLDDLSTVAAVRALADDGIPTWVIGYDTPELTATLNAMAVAGDTGRSTYIPVEDQATLSAALDEIAADLVSCTYTLSVTPGDPSYVRVLLDGTLIPPSAQTLPDGGLDPAVTGTFILEDGNRVRLEGAACERLQDGLTHELTITRECEPVIFG
ncbi:MAG: VWA domain-containing protein [Myxococcales bacterium]|nr:VWA domain-containing protein [Myxococcales bacterium]